MRRLECHQYGRGRVRRRFTWPTALATPSPSITPVTSPATGRERYIGSHFGVFAKPVPAFINNVSANPDDTAATITWTTIIPPPPRCSMDLPPTLILSTTAQLGAGYQPCRPADDLTPGTGYYFAALGTIGTNQYTSSNLFFVTTNYVTTNALFDLTNTWNSRPPTWTG